MNIPNSKIIASIEKRYADLQSQFVIEEGPSELARAVTFDSNQSAPVHRWFAFKEAFGADLLDFLSIDESRMRARDSAFMDPFCGCGTSILSGDLQQGWVCHRIGVETNPFIAFVANTKVNWRQFDPVRVERYARNILASPLRKDMPEDEWPNLSTFRDPEMFDKERVSALVDAVFRSRTLPTPYADLFLLGIASAVERLSLYRKTGRALRKLRGSKSLQARLRIKTEAELLRVWLLFAFDIKQVAQFRKHESTHSTIIQGDGRSLDDPRIRTIGPSSVSLMVYSPPYLNQIDYTEVYKVESWLLGFTDSTDTMRNQRLATVRSHSSIKFPESRPELTTDAEAALQLVNAVISSSGKSWHQKFLRTAYGYFSDMQQSLRRQFQVLEPGAQVRCIIGNSVHGAKGRRITVATDLFIADIAVDVGFEVSKIQVARMLPRGDQLNSYMRESILWMRKPNA